MDQTANVAVETGHLIHARTRGVTGFTAVYTRIQPPVGSKMKVRSVTFNAIKFREHVHTVVKQVHVAVRISHGLRENVRMDVMDSIVVPSHNIYQLPSLRTLAWNVIPIVVIVAHVIFVGEMDLVVGRGFLVAEILAKGVLIAIVVHQ